MATSGHTVFRGEGLLLSVRGWKTNKRPTGKCLGAKPLFGKSITLPSVLMK
jgi:hypothetical protein